MPLTSVTWCEAGIPLVPTSSRPSTSTRKRWQKRLCARQSRCLAPSGVTNGAAVVLHNPSGEVRALVGSADYWNPVISGQVIGAIASRAAGSALKPLIYGTALDLGLLLPSSVLYDVPSMFGDYAPENFDRSWRGLIRADKALAWSLNIPAMEVLERRGVERMLAYLERAGVRPTTPENRNYGLSLAVERAVPAPELTNAYAAIARGGEWRLLCVLLDDPSIACPGTLTAAERSNTAWLSQVHSHKRPFEAPASNFPSNDAPFQRSSLLLGDSCT